MFSIEFESIDPMDDSELATGSIVLEGFRETFESPLHVWKREDYEAQWDQAICRLINGKDSTAIITGLYDPAYANFIQWWPAFRFEGEVRFHSQLLLMEQLDAPFDLDDVYRHVAGYEQVSEDGTPISEWSVPIDALESFLWRQSSRR
ncbi:MAG: hypothetical protein WBF71_01345 [Microthrixaceae bacterium]